MEANGYEDDIEASSDDGPDEDSSLHLRETKDTDESHSRNQAQGAGAAGGQSSYQEDPVKLSDNARGWGWKVPFPEALPPARDIGYPEAMPLMASHQIPSSHAEPSAFRMVGFGRYRAHYGARKRVGSGSEGGDDEDTDGQYDSAVDADGRGSSTNLGHRKCKHKTIEDHKCTNCSYTVTKFGSFFDSGSIPRYLRILQMSDTEEQAAAFGRELDLIYESYAPTNIIQMRDHMQTMIGRSMVSHIKNKESDVHAFRVLPTEALYSDALEHVKSYQQYRTDFKEQKEHVMKSDALFIDSYLEAGNIEKVFKTALKGSQEYHLFMDVDTNTQGHQQWFLFRVRNMRKDTKYKFNIWNFTKPKSLFKDGMAPMWRSKKKCKLLGIPVDEDGWEFIPSENIDGDLTYKRASLRKSKEKRGMFGKLFEEDAKKEKEGKGRGGQAGGDEPAQYVKKMKENLTYYCLSFTLTFDYSRDTVYISYSRPYKYTQMILDILKNENALMEQDREKYPEEKRTEAARWNGEAEIVLNNQIVYTRKLMCVTLSGLPVPILTVTGAKHLGKNMRKREGVFLTSRVHPGETNSSFVFQGILERLTKVNDPVAQYLRENFVFKLVPCLNPDGVVKGNYRSSFAGVDLNRQWIVPGEFLHPTIFHAKKEIEKLYKERPVLLYCDLHGHSRKKNSFVYGCNRAANGGFSSWTKVRLLPRILARNSHVFDITACKFKVEKGKLGTGRVVVWKEFEVTNSFTLENSFHGYDYGDTFKEYSVYDFKQLGADLLASIHHYQKILLEIHKELTITRGWLKPKRLLEVTGQPAQEKLKQEARERSRAGRRAAAAQAYNEETQATAQAPPKTSGSQKPPRGPVVKSRGGPGLTLQGLIDQYVQKEEAKKQQEESSRQSNQTSSQASNAIDSKSASTTPKPQRSSSQKGMSLNSRTISQSTQRLDPVDKKAESGGGGGAHEQKRFADGKELNRSSRRDLKDDSDHDEEANPRSKEEKIVAGSIVKIQSFIRMVICRTKYLELQIRQQEDELEQLLEEDASPDQPSETGHRKGLASQTSQPEELKVPKDSQTGKGHPALGSKHSADHLFPGPRLQNQMQDKYMNQLTLEVIESESLVQAKNRARAAKPATAAAGVPGRLGTLGSTTPMSEHESEIRDETMTMTVTVDHDQEYEVDRQSEADQLSQSEVSAKHDWRQFFTIEELTTAFDKIQRGEDPTEDEVAGRSDAGNESPDNGSESCPSEDNLDAKELYSTIYCDRNKSRDTIAAKQKVEAQYEKDFANFVKKLHKRYRDASKESGTSAGVGDAPVPRHMHRDGQPCLRCNVRAEEAAQRNSGMLRLDASLDKNEDGDHKVKKNTKVNLIITGKGQSIENEEEKDGRSGSKRRGKAFIISNTKNVPNSKKPASNAQSPMGNRTQQKVGNRVVGISDTLKKAMNIKNRRLRSQEANQTHDGPRANSSNANPGPQNTQNTQSRAQAGNSASRVPAAAVASPFKVSTLPGTARNNAFLPVLSGKPGSAGINESGKIMGDGANVPGSSASLELHGSDSQASPGEAALALGIHTSAPAGVAGSSAIYGSLTYVGTRQQLPNSTRPSDLGREDLSNMQSSHYSGQMAQTETDGFPGRQQMMQLGVPGAHHRPVGSSPGTSGQLGSSWGSIRTPVAQKQLNPHQGSGVALQGQRQSIVSQASLSSNGMTMGQNQHHYGYQTAHGVPLSTPGTQKPPVHQFMQTQNEQQLLKGSQVTLHSHTEQRIPGARSPVTGASLGAIQAGTTGPNPARTLRNSLHAFATAQSQAGLVSSNAAGLGGTLVGREQTNRNPLPKASRSPGPGELENGQPVGLLNQRTVVLRQEPGASLLGGGLAGSGLDPKMNAAAGGAQGFRSPQVAPQGLMRPQSFGLQSLLPPSSLPPASNTGQRGQLQVPATQLPNQDAQAKMAMMRSPPRRQIDVTPSGTTPCFSPRSGDQQAQIMQPSNHDRNRMLKNRQEYAADGHPVVENGPQLMGQAALGQYQAAALAGGNQAQKGEGPPSNCRAPNKNRFSSPAGPGMGAQETSSGTPAAARLRKPAATIHISLSSLQNTSQAQALLGMAHSPNRSQGPSTGQPPGARPMHPQGQRPPAQSGPQAAAAMSSKTSGGLLPPAGRPPQNHAQRTVTHQRSPVALGSAPGQGPSLAALTSKGLSSAARSHSGGAFR